MRLVDLSTRKTVKTARVMRVAILKEIAKLEVPWKYTELRLVTLKV